MGTRFQAAARRLLDEQGKLTRFFKANLPEMDDQAGEVSLYLLSVIIRIFQECGGRLGRVGPAEIDAATKKIQAAAKSLLPAGEDFPARVREVADRAQPHILDEALEALFERAERKEGEVDLAHPQAGLVFLMLWAAVEALELAWSAPPSPGWAAPAEAG
jgi:hypothetical protein